MKLIVGLGNPGLEYKNTKHNIGFAVVESLAKDHRIKIKDKLHFSVVGKGKIFGDEVVLALPQTFMNLSGKAVGELLTCEGARIEDILVVCDDINLELGKIRLRKQGSSGGHKGLESIIHTLNSDGFARLRIGIATEVHRGDITNYVLSPFKRRQMRNVLHAIELAKESIECLLKDGIDKAMSRYNKRKVGTS
ncbi:MAG: aminoacyl-tRNA hydrolase [Candidatus Omnitrophica bacterium]|nr:aminoacyl-tRNA hydrolase [Candidatus Omnitrophota bacterium]MCM8791185.1 aminoacyl-tRNA hydrolase [Candidatus Omnitrophota bacterium]